MKDDKDRIQSACEKMVEMIKAKQEFKGLQTYVELANAIQFYADGGVKINEDHIGGYLRKRKDGTYIFPSIEKLKAIGLFLGYELDEFYDLLFDSEPVKKAGRDIITDTWQKIQSLSKNDKISLHRFLSEELYRELLF